MLANLSGKFGNRCQENYGLCPNHYLSAPVLSWDAMLSVTKVELYVISDVYMYFFLEKKAWEVALLIFLKGTAK